MNGVMSNIPLLHRPHVGCSSSGAERQLKCRETAQIKNQECRVMASTCHTWKVGMALIPHSAATVCVQPDKGETDMLIHCNQYLLHRFLIAIPFSLLYTDIGLQAAIGIGLHHQKCRAFSMLHACVPNKWLKMQWGLQVVYSWGCSENMNGSWSLNHCTVNNGGLRHWHPHLLSRRPEKDAGC